SGSSSLLRPRSHRKQRRQGVRRNVREVQERSLLWIHSAISRFGSRKLSVDSAARYPRVQGSKERSLRRRLSPETLSVSIQLLAFHFSSSVIRGDGDSTRSGFRFAPFVRPSDSRPELRQPNASPSRARSESDSRF